MYVVAHPKGTKSPKLYKTKQNGGRTMGVIPDANMWSNDPVEIKGSEIVVHLGDDPPIGSVYGVWIEPVVKRQTIKGYGEIISFVDNMPEVVEARALKSFPIALKRVRALGPQCDWEMQTELRNPKGTRAGYYQFRPKGTDTLTLYPIEGQSTREMVKVVAHELAHGIWYRHMDASGRAEWISLYDRFVQVTDVSQRDVKVMVRDMRQIGSVRDYIKDAEPEEQAAADIFCRWLHKVHSIDKRELNDLIVSGSEVPMPNTHLHRSDTQTPVTLYSKRTDATELFAEAVSCEIVGDLSNKHIRKLVHKLSDQRTKRERRERRDD